METKVSGEAFNQIQMDEEERKRKIAEQELSNGCWASSSRVSIYEDGEEKRKRKSEELRILGNEAQASLRLKDYGDVIKDALHSVELNPNIIKTYVILARGLKGQKEFNKAIEVLFTLQNSQKDLTDLELKVVHDLVTCLPFYRNETVKPESSVVVSGWGRVDPKIEASGFPSYENGFKGDSGGPITLEEYGMCMLVGVISQGIQCGTTVSDLAGFGTVGLNTAKLLRECYDGQVACLEYTEGCRISCQKNCRERCHTVCTSLYKYFKKPTVAAVYTAPKLNRLLEQRWTGHLVTVTVILKSIVHLHCRIESTQTSAADFVLDLPNTAHQSKSTDLYTGVILVKSALRVLRSDAQFETFWEKLCQDRKTTETPAAAPLQK
ncbi:unnamed protein product [Lepeophtheirus salmonis]|uniref:(salmon louse) hypothetical protein n=1 Tax=Lepeophtheirus salmonis TaxID=72036 RepID=A0A7R8CKI4_LEPSM|nr:unnamed protein product [Lepeophtheirus salmonis]CAF2803991.1 unnamed protein product [Lepeophtheirus salmonis]